MHETSQFLNQIDTRERRKGAEQCVFHRGDACRFSDPLQPGPHFDLKADEQLDLVEYLNSR